MLLLALLTTLFLGDTTKIDTTKKVSPKAQPAIGVFYMTGPRAYDSKGFVGVQGQMPFAKGKWVATLGVGGYFEYNEEGYRTEPSQDTTQRLFVSDIAEIPVTYVRTQGYLLKASAMRSYPILEGLNLEVGLTMGYSRVEQKRNYKRLPLRILDQYTAPYYEQTWRLTETWETKQAQNAWAAPILGVSFQATKKITISSHIVAGPFLVIQKYYYLQKDLDFSGHYSNYIDGKYDPYHINGPIAGRGVFYNIDPHRLPENRFGLIRLNSITFSVSHQF